jgi:phospholipid/cholesterol/gamma-HCH transport system permease protein
VPALVAALRLHLAHAMSKWQIVRSGERLAIAGELRIGDAPAIWSRLRVLAADPPARLDLDLSDAELVDGAIMSLLVDVRGTLAARGTQSEIVAVPPRIAPLVHLYRGDQPVEAATPVIASSGSPIVWLGTATLAAAQHTRTFIAFTGQLLGTLVADARHINWRALPGLVERHTTDGIPVVMVADFLIGFTMAYQSMVQLKMYGANIYVADIVGVSVVRELSPLMTAVIVVGRSGAAFAAELGAMRVSEEIDALRVMGFTPASHLVAPRIIALAIAAPVLTLYGDVAGVFGGFVVAKANLGVSHHAFISELRSALASSDVWTGLVKSMAFGIAIALIGCRQGLAASGAATGVGRSTTATVVVSTFAVIVLDTLFTVIFRGLGL